MHKESDKWYLIVLHYIIIIIIRVNVCYNKVL